MAYRYFPQRLMPRGLTALALCVLAAALLGACGEEENLDKQPLELIGSYQDQFGFPHEITQEVWDSSDPPNFTLIFNIKAYSNENNVLVARNDDSNGFNAGLYSRFIWITPGTDIYYCQNPFDAATAEDALLAPLPDPADPTTGGCDGFAWSQLIPN